MYQPVVVYIGLRYAYRRTLDGFSRFICWISPIGITIGVTSLVTILSVMNGFERHIKSNILDLIPHVLLTTSTEQLDPTRISATCLLELQGVMHIAPLTTGEIVLQSANGITVGVMLGVHPNDPEPLFPYCLDIHINQLVEGQYQVILGEQLAHQLSVKLGDPIRLMVPSVNQFTPIGRIPSHRIFTVAGIYNANSEVDSYQLLVNQEDASRLMRYPIGYVTGWRLWLQQPLSSVDRISQQPLPEGLIWKDWRERKGSLFQAVRMEKNMMGILLSLIIAVAAFNIIISVGLLVIEKQGEVAILQTQGLIRRRVMLIFMIQGLSTGIIGAVGGICLGVLLASNLNNFIPFFGTLLNVSVLSIDIELMQVTMISLLALIIAVLSTLYPSWYAAAIPPAEALRYE